eukprot:GILI01004051.1.p1 GENE.GILI01004051.1~~GILI01004051.1.p1  ORF type:complete len:616 (-),score=156.37 GILI01004051.1:344-2092(-)
MMNYRGSSYRGIDSMARVAYTRSIKFADAPPVRQVSCGESTSHPYYKGDSGTKFLVACPKGCSTAAGDVFGTDIYTDDSSICRAAIHFGAVSDEGGEVEVIIEDGRKKYLGTNRNMILAKEREEYIRSFRFDPNTAKSLCRSFREDYIPSDFFKHWEVLDLDDALGGPSDWSFAPHPTRARSLSIAQSRPIKNDKGLGTFAVLKDYDCSNGDFQANMYMTDLKSVGIAFRFRDPQNFYLFEMVAGENGRMRLRKMKDGLMKDIATLPRSYSMKTWYRVRILYAGSNIQVLMSKDGPRRTEMLFNVTDGDLTRGTIALHSSGQSSVYFDAIGVEMWKPNALENCQTDPPIPSYAHCLSESDVGHRRKFCRSVYGSDDAKVSKCMILDRYCTACCTSVIPNAENIAQYTCWKDCRKSALERGHFESAEQMVRLSRALNPPGSPGSAAAAPADSPWRVQPQGPGLPPLITQQRTAIPIRTNNFDPLPDMPPPGSPLRPVMQDVLGNIAKEFGSQPRVDDSGKAKSASSIATDAIANMFTSPNGLQPTPPPVPPPSTDPAAGKSEMSSAVEKVLKDALSGLKLFGR